MKVITEAGSEYQCIPEFERLLDLFIELQPKRILEIGSLMGWTLRHWLKFAPADSDIISIDLPVRDFLGPHDSRVAEQEYNYKFVWPTWADSKHRLHQIHERSQSLTALTKVRDIVNGKLDFIFIDGDHTFEGISGDFWTYRKLVKKGIIAFHDIGWKEDGAGYKFWETIKDEYRHEEILLDPHSKKGIGVLFINM